ncbi:MAG: ATP-binding cassette domain-containing protein [Myxococcales bacterium]|nr:ATP-binding cassette domain-containing protein [Myxococcales bacterium]MCB9566326.1 ATP-binding cassette domain-containing protein [Myxococcales bacterium]MCB9702616.1 ATP-binding cassette domain-containing protein [Myxococcales bacterium]
MAAVIELRHVDKAFGSHVVYQNMSLTIEEGETLTVIGGSGQGKSVCLKLMIGLLLADEGDVLFRGQEVSGLGHEGLRDLRRKVAMVFQGGALFDSMNIRENVGYALTEHTKMSDDEITRRAWECLGMVGLGQDRSILERMPSSLSGGMRKRVAIARSIALQPEVILYDEPTTGLDPSNIRRIGAMIRKLQGELGVTSIVVTHDMPTAFSVSNRIAMLYDRNFPYVGTPDSFKQSEVPEVRNFVQGRIADGA